MMQGGNFSVAEWQLEPLVTPSVRRWCAGVVVRRERCLDCGDSACFG